MKHIEYKNILIATAMLIFLSLMPARAAVDEELSLYPINTQFAEMRDGWQATVDFNYSRYAEGASALGGLVSASLQRNLIQLPKVDVRYTFDERYRVGLNIPLVYGDVDTSFSFFGFSSSSDSSAFGFGNLGLTLEAQLREGVVAYINQQFPTNHSGLIAGNGGFLNRDTYSFETGLELQKELIKNRITFFSNLGYRFDVPEAGPIAHAFVHRNALVWDTDTIVNPFIELVGINDYTIEVTDMRLVPGWVSPIGEDNEYQLHVGFPIGINHPDTPDFGVQAGIFAKL